MDRPTKRQMKDLAKATPQEQVKERKQAGKVRRALRKGKGETREQRVTEENWENLLDLHGRSRRRPSLEKLVSDLHHEQATYTDDPLDFASAGIVMNVASGRCRIFANGDEIDCFFPPEIAVRQKSALAVGDRVQTRADESGVCHIETILPRRSVLARPDPLHAHRQRLVAANVDVVIHVVSVKAPPLRPRLIDRYLIAIQRGGAQPVICVNKVDLLSPEERNAEIEKLAPYLELGVPVIGCSTKTGEGLEALRVEVEGKMTALVGHSGVGKSSIVNALDTTLGLATNTLHRRGTGRHTTSTSTLYDFGEGTYLIDTPGIREFGLWDLDRDSLRDYFPEFETPAELCRFTNCTHVHEPNCEVKERVEAGELSEARYGTYVRLWEDLA
ncbi:MAG: ribosome biosis GTPase / thiamine phosphate phosphatase [Acidobacteriota bacterium]|jgi:ribosome biogenesis GTPase|nr:ribosome biosis GTPase / thiamine phosphate phosphatase [Acidobacteriota bacterium]